MWDGPRCTLFVRYGNLTYGGMSGMEIPSLMIGDLPPP
jgi:hypothetical protein